MDTLSSIVQRTKRLRSVNHRAVGGREACPDSSSLITENDLYEAVDKSDIGTASSRRRDSAGAGIDTEADDVVSANMMIYLNSGSVPKALVYAGPCRELSNSSWLSSAQSQTLAPSIQQCDHSYSTTIDYSHSFVPSAAKLPPTESPFDHQNGCGLCYLSTFQSIHKLTEIDGTLKFNYQAQSSFNTLLPHPHHLDSGFRAPESNYICVPCPPSPHSPYQTSIHCEDMTWPPTTNQSGLLNLIDLTGEQYPGPLPTMSQSGVPQFAYENSVHYPPTMSQSELPDLENEEYVDDQSLAPNSSGHWKASLNPAEGQEGFTPYLHQQEFEKAEDVLDEDNDDVDAELIFNNFQEAVNWRSRTRNVNPQSSADPTIPRTGYQKKAAVKLVFKAYKSTALATDNPGMLKAFEDQKHDNRQVEAICWSIVEGCIDRCHRGPLLNAYEPEKAKNSPSIKSFAERLDAIVGSLSRQKTICKHLLDAPYLNRFIDDPVGSKQRVESNRKLNKKKGGVMDVGKKALGMTGKKGRPRGEKSSDAASDDEAEEYKSESQEFRGESSGISSPFRTPDQPVRQANGSSGPPSMNLSRLYSAERFRNETPTPSSRRRRAGTTTSQTPLRNQTPQSPSSQQYGSGGDMSPNIGQGVDLSSVGMLPGPLMDPNLPPYTSTSPYGVGSFDTYQASYGAGHNFASMNSFENASNTYTSRTNDTYYDAYATGPTSAPQQLFENLQHPEIVPNVSGPLSNDSNGSDDEYQPEPSRKRRRQN